MRNLFKLRYGYRNIVEKYPNGLGNRMERFDKWVRTWGDPNLTSYYAYYLNA